MSLRPPGRALWCAFNSLETEKAGSRAALVAPAWHYEIRVSGQLDEGYTVWFEGMRVRNLGQSLGKSLPSKTETLEDESSNRTAGASAVRGRQGSEE